MPLPVLMHLAGRPFLSTTWPIYLAVSIVAVAVFRIWLASSVPKIPPEQERDLRGRLIFMMVSSCLNNFVGFVV